MRPIISVAELDAALAGVAPPTLLDVRWRLGGPPGLDSFRAGHIPCAWFVDLDRDLSGPPGPGGRHPLPETGAFQAAMRRSGVSGDREVVVYDEDDASSAARAWWLLRHFGHRGVRVLDGGYRAWAGSGRPVTAGRPGGVPVPGPRVPGDPVPGDFVARPGAMPVLSAEQAAALAREGVLLDARARERYRGESEPVDPVPGHVPGAVSAPATGNVEPDGRFLPPERLCDRFAALGVGPGVPAGAYCGSGVTAAAEVLALELAGISAALYVGSWSHWVADPSRPVVTGGEPG
ncbi:MAG: sulfurtransferase [Streptomycetales bacterium]